MISQIKEDDYVISQEINVKNDENYEVKTLDLNNKKIVQKQNLFFSLIFLIFSKIFGEKGNNLKIYIIYDFKKFRILNKFLSF